MHYPAWIVQFAWHDIAVDVVVEMLSVLLCKNHYINFPCFSFLSLSFFSLGMLNYMDILFFTEIFTFISYSIFILYIIPIPDLYYLCDI